MKAYDAHLPLLDQYAGRLRPLVEDLIQAAGVSTHSVSARVKSRESLERKLQLSEGKYSNLDDVTDCLGIRVITYFSDDVDRVADLVERNFDIDPINSVDRRKTIDADRFGYLSLHYIARLGSDRGSLPEYQPYAHRVFEVQIRSILQHAWAEIEHDLGYKAASEVPREYRRRFSRLAGLLEIGDAEFLSLRDELRQYSREVEKTVSEKPEAVPIDRDTLIAFATDNDVVAAVDRLVAEAAGETISGPPDPRTMGSRVSELTALELRTIGEIERSFNEQRDLITKFARAFLVNYERGRTPWTQGISLYYLWLVLLILRNRSWAAVREALMLSGRTESLARQLERRLEQTWNAMVFDGQPRPGPRQ